MSEVKILKGVPIPPISSHKYPWNEVEVGDCFAYERYSNAIAQAKNHTTNGKEFIARKLNGVPHVWRTK